MHGGGPKVRPQLLGPDSGLVPVVWTNMLGVEAGLSHYISARHVCLLELQVSKSREKQTTEQNFALALAYDKKKEPQSQEKGNHMHRRSQPADGNCKFDVFLLTHSDANTSTTASHQTPKQEFSNLW